MAMARLGESYVGLGIPILQALTRLVFLDRNLVTSAPLGSVQTQVLWSDSVFTPFSS
jgi:hypothetical protein